MNPKPDFKICPFCAEEIREQAIKCRYCGSLLGEQPGPGQAKIQTPDNKEEASDRRNVAVLFADISGFTALSEKLDPEALHDLMNSCFEALTPAVKKYEGTIDKYIGDAIMVLFGAPVAHEDDPSRAVMTALEMKNKLAEFNKTRKDVLPLPINMTIGINFGLVLAGSVGSEGKRDYTVMGDAVNLASRLQSRATAGQILVSEIIYRRTNDVLEYKPLGEVTVKGKTEPVNVYELLDKKSVSAETGKMEIGKFYAPLVGRENEKELLLKAAQNCLAGKKQIVFVKGKAGIGKTRLVEEIVREISGQGFNILILRGRCFSYNEAQSFQPFIVMLKSYFMLQETYDRKEAKEKISARLKDLGPNYELLSNSVINLLFPENRESEDFEEENREGGSEGFDQSKIIGNIINAVSGTKPLALILEDLHWTDKESLELLNMLPDSAQGQKIFFLITYRLQEIEEKPEKAKLINSMRERWQKHRALDLSEIELNELSDKAAEELSRTFITIENLPEELVQKIKTKSQGNPLFIVQLLNALIDRRVLVNQEGKWLFKATGEISIPETINEIILSRIDRLSPEEKNILQTASVFGINFKLEELTKLLGRDRDKVNMSLQKLEKLGLVIKGEGEYRFIHALCRDTVYNSILLKTRQALHEKISSILENEAKSLQGQTEAIIYHFQQAEKIEKTIPYFLEMADKAIKMRLKEKAEECCLAAFNLLSAQTPPELRFEVLIKTGKITRLLNKYDLALQNSENALNLAKEIRDNRKIVQAMLELGWYYIDTAKHENKIKNTENGRKTFFEAAIFAEENKYYDLAAEGYYYLATIMKYAEGKKYTEQGLPETEKAITLARESKNHLILGKALRFRAGYEINKNRWAEALTLLNEALTEIEISNNSGVKTRILSDLAKVYFEMNNLSEYEKYSEFSIQSAKEGGSPFVVNTAFNKWAQLEAKRENYERAIQLYDECIQAVNPFKELNALAQCYNHIADLYIKLHRTDEALKNAEAGYKVAKESNARFYISMLCNTLARIYHYLKNYEKAISYLEERISVTDSPFYNCSTFSTLAKVYKETNNEQKYRETIERAIKYCHEKNYRPDYKSGLPKLFYEYAEYKGDKELAEKFREEVERESSKLSHSKSEGFRARRTYPGAGAEEKQGKPGTEKKAPAEQEAQKQGFFGKIIGIFSPAGNKKIEYKFLPQPQKNSTIILIRGSEAACEKIKSELAHLRPSRTFPPKYERNYDFGFYINTTDQAEIEKAGRIIDKI